MNSDEKHYVDFKSWCELEGREVERHEISKQNFFQGKIPYEISGNWIRNGPGKFKVGEQHVVPLDGDGFIYKVSFTQGKAFIQTKFVETKGYIREKRDERVYQRGAFGTPHHKQNFTLIERLTKPGVGLPKLKNTANTSVVAFGKQKQLLALWEGGLPHLLNMEHLETLEQDSRLNNCLRRGDMFSAHPKIDTKTNHLFNVGTNIEENMRKAPTKSLLKVWQINKEFNLVSKQYVKLQRSYAVVHEFGLSENFIVIPQPPISMKVSHIFMGGNLTTAWKALEEPLLFYILRKHQEGVKKYPATTVLKAKCSFCFHVVNTFEIDNALTIDMIIYKNMPNLAAILDPSFANFDNETEPNLGKFVRYTFPIQDGNFHELSLYEPEFMFGRFDDKCGVEFPVINENYNGKTYNFAYFVNLSRTKEGKKYEQLKSLVKFTIDIKDVMLWKPEIEDLFLNEPSFVSKECASKEDDGYLLFSAYHGHISQSSSFYVVDALNMTTICHFRLDVPVPVGVHTIWQEEESQKARL